MRAQHTLMTYYASGVARMINARRAARAAGRMDHWIHAAWIHGYVECMVGPGRIHG